MGVNLYLMDISYGLAILNNRAHVHEDVYLNKHTSKRN